MLRWLLGLLVGVVVAAAAALIVLRLLAPVNSSGSDVIIDIPSGATPPEIGRRLYAAGVVRAPSHFVLASRVRRVSRGLRTGEYRLSPAMGLFEIVDQIALGHVVLHPVTIPEGFTAEQIVDTLAARGLGDADRLRALARDGARLFPHAFLQSAPGASLEGYLFPDTYQIPRHLTEEQVLALFLDRFADVVLPLWAAEGGGRSLHEIVTLASLIEREAKVPDEQPLIAGVLANRLRRGWRLEVDATVLYALGRHKPIVTFEDLTVDSPYNTYRHPGLPPGPIANPGLGAIRAALRPTPTDFLYYVARGDGSHVFSRTLAEHQAAIRRYRRP